MTLKMLTGLIEPTTGRVLYSGLEVTGGIHECATVITTFPFGGIASVMNAVELAAPLGSNIRGQRTYRPSAPPTRLVKRTS